MSPSNFLLVVILYIFISSCKSTRCDVTSPSATRGLEFRGTIDSRRNDTGELVTTIRAESTSKSNQTDIKMEVHHTYLQCEGGITVMIHGVIREFPILEKLETNVTVPKPKVLLRFHQRCGDNVEVTNQGKTVKKKDSSKWNDGVTFTNRALDDDELFEVVVDEKVIIIGFFIGIGVTTYSPETIEIPSDMDYLKSGNWMMYHSGVYKDGSLIKTKFIKELTEITVGDKLGVKRTSSGDLHLFINGEDQGVAASGLPSPVYGVFELYGDVTKVTIVDH